MKIEPFGVELWMNAWETKCDWNLAETCVESLKLGQLLEIAGQSPADLTALAEMKMTYGAIQGSERLRQAIARLYTSQTAENVVVTHGTIGANMLVHKTLVSRGDHVVAMVPTYQQHYSIPASIGARVEHLHLRETDGWLPDIDALRNMVTPDTVLIALNNPNNPTGALIGEAGLRAIVEIARAADSWLLCDEVYRGTDQDGDGTSVSVADLYEKGISTSGMSKAFSLAGLRLGWIAGPSALIEDVMIHRDYDTISVGVMDDYFATLALENSARILARSREITRGNLAQLADWVAVEPLISWVPPKSGTTALLRYDLPMASRGLCIDLLRETGVLLTPGAALGMEGYLRIGYANGPDILREGLRRLSEYLSLHR